MSLTTEQKEFIRVARDKDRRKKLRMAYPGQAKPWCEAMTERHTKCRNFAKDGSRYCGQHTRGRYA